ncbi:hypothetical protein BaRGS_00029099 [Batillaria attramentaria]|uniref:Uncharacterized protein n=1 Tax=Batillaria attramentaria TaxID=370345 RepID=A0ABD0JXK8_9CAEN
MGAIADYRDADDFDTWKICAWVFSNITAKDCKSEERKCFKPGIGSSFALQSFSYLGRQPCQVPVASKILTGAKQKRCCEEIGLLDGVRPTHDHGHSTAHNNTRENGPIALYCTWHSCTDVTPCSGLHVPADQAPLIHRVSGAGFPSCCQAALKSHRQQFCWLYEELKPD